MLTVTSWRSECCVPSGLDFEAIGDSVVRYFVSNYLLWGLWVAVNMMWVTSVPGLPCFDLRFAFTIFPISPWALFRETMVLKLISVHFHWCVINKDGKFTYFEWNNQYTCDSLVEKLCWLSLLATLFQESWISPCMSSILQVKSLHAGAAEDLEMWYGRFNSVGCELVASSPGHSQHFNVARWIWEGPLLD